MRELIFPSGEDRYENTVFVVSRSPYSDMSVFIRFIRSLARCVKFEAKGGKSRAMFLKTYGELTNDFNTLGACLCHQW